MDEFAAQAATKKLTPESMAMRADEAGRWHGDIRRNDPDLYGMTEGPR